MAVDAPLCDWVSIKSYTPLLGLPLPLLLNLRPTVQSGRLKLIHAAWV